MIKWVMWQNHNGWNPSLICMLNRKIMFSKFVTFGAKEHSSNNNDITAGPRSFSRGIASIHASTMSNHPFSEVENRPVFGMV